ncbi:cyclic diguanylate phosphodiesterase [Aquitalea sp. FJL05]|uniref:EAL domain-containing protein n=1 Tax=Aquitalea sp. FJL05 TaxID=2153366 RepID=UPI000F5A7CA0|nr:EAL domain-containing protein [Aquitalea sp. FJL05]RQO67102.1 cyclic diguanylate phosphodiesterase [Aquitalea sp. FJL05]
MQFPSIEPLGRSQRIMLTMLPGLALFMLGGLLMLYQFHAAIQHALKAQLAYKLEKIEQIVDRAQRTGEGMLQQPSVDCQVIYPEMRRQVTIQPYVRSMRLIDHAGRVYCDSVIGWHAPAYSQEYPRVQRLQLKPGNRLSPWHPLLLLWLEAKRTDVGGIQVVVDSEYLKDRLTHLEQDSWFYLHVGDSWLSESGEMTAPQPRPYWQQRRLASARYPLELVMDFSMPAMLQQRASQEPDQLLLLLLFSCTFSWGFHRLLLRSGAPSRELQRAVRQQEFIPYLQPLVDSQHLQWCGVEVLMRWQHPLDGMVLPELFIPFAESTGHIVAMTRSLMQQTAAQLGVLSLPAGFQISINVSAAYVADGSLPADCAAFLSAFPPGSIRLTLELTERELINTGPQTDALLAQLHDLGVRIAIDDFGTGHSSLSYLQKMDVDELKIDRSFVAGIGSDSLSADILDSILQLAAKLGLTVVAEGVECMQQEDYLRQHGAHLLQGYRYARPMPISEFMLRPEWHNRPSEPRTRVHAEVHP